MISIDNTNEAKYDRYIKDYWKAKTNHSERFM